MDKSAKIFSKHSRLYFWIDLVLKMARYNLKIIFAGRFIWFVLAALLFFILLSIQLVFNTPGFNSSSVYGILIFPGILLVFYPTVFGIQSDADSRILEILFGIPDYRYKVWMVPVGHDLSADLVFPLYLLLGGLLRINSLPCF